MARCLCVQASEEHISVVEAATHGEEITACSTDVDDVCSGSLKSKIPLLSKCLREVRQKRQGRGRRGSPVSSASRRVVLSGRGMNRSPSSVLGLFLYRTS